MEVNAPLKRSAHEERGPCTMELWSTRMLFCLSILVSHLPPKQLLPNGTPHFRVVKNTILYSSRTTGAESQPTPHEEMKSPGCTTTSASSIVDAAGLSYAWWLVKEGSKNVRKCPICANLSRTEINRIATTLMRSVLCVLTEVYAFC